MKMSGRNICFFFLGINRFLFERYVCVYLYFSAFFCFGRIGRVVRNMDGFLILVEKAAREGFFRGIFEVVEMVIGLRRLSCGVFVRG